MWRRGAGHLPVWLQHSGFHSSTGLTSRVVAAEVAQVVSLQTFGMVELPNEVQQGIEQAAAGKIGPLCNVLTLQLSWQTLR